jgi:hypothetical protein
VLLWSAILTPAPSLATSLATWRQQAWCRRHCACDQQPLLLQAVHDADETPLGCAVKQLLLLLSR